MFFCFCFSYFCLVLQTKRTFGLKRRWPKSDVWVYSVFCLCLVVFFGHLLPTDRAWMPKNTRNVHFPSNGGKRHRNWISCRLAVSVS